MIDRDSVLQHLDRYMDIDAGIPPLVDMINTHFELADAQMCVFASSDDWLIVFEWIGYSPNQGEFLSNLYVYGSMFYAAESGDSQQREQPEGTGFAGEIGLLHAATYFEISVYEREEVIIKLPPPYDDEPCYDEVWTYPAGYVSVQTPSQTRQFPIDEASLSSSDIPFKLTASGQITLPQAQLLRHIVHASDHGLFRTPAEILNEVTTAFPQLSPDFWNELKPLLQVREWQHPDIIARESTGELPSASPSMQVVASIIAENNSSLWHTSDIGVPNTDWRLHYLECDFEDDAGEAAGYKRIPRGDTRWQQF